MIEWRCPNCDDCGVISGWEGTPWDLSKHRSHAVDWIAAEANHTGEAKRLAILRRHYDGITAALDNRTLH